MADDFHPAPGPRATALRGVAVAAILAFGVWAFFRFGSESCQPALPRSAAAAPARQAPWWRWSAWWRPPCLSSGWSPADAERCGTIAG